MPAKGDQTKCALFPEPVWKSDLSRMQGRGGTFLRKSRRGRAEKLLDLFLYFCDYRNIKNPIRFWSRALLTASLRRRPPRLEIVRLLLSAHPAGMVAGEVQEELEIPASTLSHHLEKLKQVGLVNVRRVGTFLWYSANTDALREVLGFLYEECCTRSRAVAPESFVQISR
jgi:ArsR family transcriptional regulator, arsenate/arsenite/antimonite-responsive transcriptional repressor